MDGYDDVTPQYEEWHGKRVLGILNDTGHTSFSDR